MSTTIYFPSEEKCELEFEVEGPSDNFKILSAHTYIGNARIDCTADVDYMIDYDIFIEARLKRHERMPILRQDTLEELGGEK